jgi:hypothetical protein
MNCPHHVAWLIPVRHGLHQCIQCWQVVTRKDVVPKFEDLPPEFQQRWEAHEKDGQPARAAAAAPKTSAPPAAPPAAVPDKT